MKYKLEALASLLPGRVLRFIGNRRPINADFGNFWIDASYRKWCRLDRRRTCDYCGGAHRTMSCWLPYLQG